MPFPVRPTTLIRAPRLSERLGVDLLIASETFQQTGSFKFRAAYFLASRVPHGHIITASSGNFGQALAYACKLLGKRCDVVMPTTSAKTKIEAVKEFGGNVELVDVTVKSRAERVLEISAAHPNAYVASAYDDDLVIEGNSSLAFELSECSEDFEVVVVPVGGGGLSAGLVQGFQVIGKEVDVVGAEPLLGNDAARSLREEQLLSNDTEPPTIADGARTISLGERNWAILKDGLAGIVEVPEEQIKRALQMLFLYANLKCEPTGALAIGALLIAPELFKGKRACCIISGGNVDPETYARLLSE